MKRYPSFLFELCVSLLGPPAYGSSWHCPYCDPEGESNWPSFSVRPPLKNHAIKFRCHRCKVWGDEHDLLAKFYHDDAEGYNFWLDYSEEMYPPALRSHRGTRMELNATDGAPTTPRGANTKHRGRKRCLSSPNGAKSSKSGSVREAERLERIRLGLDEGGE